MTLRIYMLAAGLMLVAGFAQAVTLRVANQRDSTSMDPRSLNESLQLTFTSKLPYKWVTIK